MALVDDIKTALTVMNQSNYGDPDTALENYFDGKELLESALLKEEQNKMHLYNECKAIVDDAIEELGTDDYGALQEFIFQTCDGHESVIYYHKAIAFCAEQRTSEGEQWLEDCGGIAQEGDSFGQIACRIAFATLLCECENILAETLEQMESEND